MTFDSKLNVTYFRMNRERSTFFRVRMSKRTKRSRLSFEFECQNKRNEFDLFSNKKSLMKENYKRTKSAQQTFSKNKYKNEINKNKKTSA